MKLAIALVLTGCIADDPELSETTSDITIAADHGTAQNYTTITLGTLASETCFIQGIAGQLAGSGAKGDRIDEANVYPDTASGHWKATGANLAQVTVMCVAVPYANHEFQFGVSSYTGTADTHCFLRYVSGPGLTTPTSNLSIASHVSGASVVFDFAGSQTSTSPYASSRATATCFDYRATGGWSYTFYAPASSTDVYLLRDYYPSGPQVKTAQTACGLTGVIGDWRASGYTHGMVLDNTSTPSWTMNVGYGVGANVACVQ